ncbi:MAG TPA: hypothetical protein VFI31_08920 [Pirellulales bacterium]|nr:hypothetical protein [Pirellulales bacterium]
MRSRIPIRRLMLVGVLLPAMIVSADSATLSAAGSSHWSAGASLWTFFLFLAQASALSYASGRWLDDWRWRLLLLVWLSVLVDLLLYCVSVVSVGGDYYGRRPELLVFGFYGSQISLGIIWAVLGAIEWRRRLAAAVLAAAPASYFLLRITSEQTWQVESWLAVTFVQEFGVLVLCGLLRAFHYRIEIGTTAGATDTYPLQFSIGHLLIWTVAAALIVSAAKQVMLYAPGGRDWRQWLELAIDGTTLAIVALAAMWMALGAGHRWTKVLVGVLLAASAGALLWYVEQQFLNYTARTWRYIPTASVGPWWIAWSLLAQPFLAALLLVLQITGYRLVRRRRPLKNKT